MIKDTNFYNNESIQYSLKRYPDVATNYIQFFFKKRLAIVTDYLSRRKRELSNSNLLEIGCADGVIVRSLLSSFPEIILQIVGIDISPGMIDVAKKLNTSPKAEFFVRGSEDTKRKYNLIIEIGVANYADIDEELLYAKNSIELGGTYILSLAGTGSFNDIWRKAKGYNNFLSYREYEAKINKYFKIERIAVCGYYIPLVWRVPVLGRIIQKIGEKVFSVFPNLAHEKVYFLKAKE